MVDMPGDDNISNLSDSRVQAIYEEEKLRKDIQNKINPPPKQPFIWGFLNSTFGIFLLSSVVITGLSKLYSDYHAYTERKSQTYTQLTALITEFDYRTREMSYFIRRLSEPNMTSDDRQGHGVLIWRVVIGHSDYQPTLPEFKGVHWLGVATKMRLVYPEVDATGVQDAIFSIETGKNSQWFYNLDTLKKNYAVIKSYDDRVTKKYINDRLNSPKILDIFSQ